MDEPMIPPKGASLEVDAGFGAALAKSRERAVTSIMRGLAIGGLGIAALAVGWYDSNSPVPFGSAIFGGGFGGLGLVLIGRALPHFLKYGYGRAVALVGAAVGLGACAAIVGLSAARVGIPLFLEEAATLGVLGFAALIVLLTIGALVRLLSRSLHDDTEASHAPSER
jgi:hypothetical protein